MTTLEQPTPYVLSEDLGVLLKRWGQETGISTPSDSYIADLTEDLCAETARATNSEVILVTAAELQDGIDSLASRCKLPILSLDRAYVTSRTPNVFGHLDLTRVVDHNLVKQEELIARPGFGSLEEQYERLRADETSPIAVIDDVVFDGDTLLKINEILTGLNRPIEQVIAGIGVQHGVDKLQANGIEVNCVRLFSKVVDEVCERDFFAGVPFSGRSVRLPDGRIMSASYFEPYGKPDEWASINRDSVKAFSRFCLRQSMGLWEEIESTSGLHFLTHHVPRPIHSIEHMKHFVSVMREHLNHFVTEGEK